MDDSKIKLVLVEDDQFLSKVLIFRLEEDDFEVALAEDGEEALPVIKKEKPDLILLDIALPKKNGFDVLRDLKADASLSVIPVVILSNLGQQSDIIRGYSLGAADYLVKANFGIKDVVAKIKEHVSRIKK